MTADEFEEISNDRKASEEFIHVKFLGDNCYCNKSYTFRPKTYYKHYKYER